MVSLTLPPKNVFGSAERNRIERNNKKSDKELTEIAVLPAVNNSHTNSLNWLLNSTNDIQIESRHWKSKVNRNWVKRDKEDRKWSKWNRRQRRRWNTWTRNENLTPSVHVKHSWRREWCMYSHMFKLINHIMLRLASSFKLITSNHKQV